MNKSNGKTAVIKCEKKFSKEQFLKSKQFEDRKDIVNALLKDKEQYSTEDVEHMIEKYMKGKVR